MTYGRNGEEQRLDRGQILTLSGLINDEKLVRLGYVALVSKGVAIVECGKCGAKFATDGGLASHGRERHRSAGPDVIIGPNGIPAGFRSDQKGEREDAIAPLYLDKTKASLAESTSNVVTTQKRTYKKRNKAAA
jgi:hypothetical protein